MQEAKKIMGEKDKSSLNRKQLKMEAANRQKRRKEGSASQDKNGGGRYFYEATLTKMSMRPQHQVSWSSRRFLVTGRRPVSHIPKKGRIC